MVGYICTGLDHPKPITVKFLLDSGCTRSALIIKYQHVENLRLRQLLDYTASTNIEDSSRGI
jgi:hypothetical protein